MEGIVDVYEEYFMNLVELPKVHFSKKNRHTCFICREESVIDGSYGKSDRTSTEKMIIEYFEHLKLFGFSHSLARIFINSIRESGILCRKVKGYWEFKEHETAYVLIIEHCLKKESNLNEEIDKVTNYMKKILLEKKFEIPKMVSRSPLPPPIEIEKYPERKISLEMEEEDS